MVNPGLLSILIIKIYRLTYDKVSSVVDGLLFLINIPVHSLSKLSNSEKKVIVFVGDRILLRSSRMAKWVKRNGDFFTILLYHKLYFVEKFSNNEWDKIFLYRNKFHLLRIIRQLKHVYLFHGFAPSSYYPDLVRRHVKVPFIIDMQDVYACYYGLNPAIRWIKAELPHEKNCLQLSDGLIGHSLEPNVALRKYGKIKPPSLFFPLYCDNDYFQSNIKSLNADDIHFVYAGGVAGSRRDKAQYGIIQFHDLIQVLSDQKIHFHIYPSPSNFKADYQEYEQISDHNNYFHFHHSVSQDQLAVELNKYHFGLLPFFLKNSGQSAEKFKYATTLKLFNYIEAGIPILVSKDLVYQNWIVKRNSAGLTIVQEDIFHLKEIISSIDYSALVAGLIRKREEISLKTHIPRLFKFYRHITGEG
ncbi:MAG TPA: hypothetical protein VIK14_09295 [Ignavibacteria bacterium]